MRSVLLLCIFCIISIANDLQEISYKRALMIAKENNATFLNICDVLPDDEKCLSLKAKHYKKTRSSLNKYRKSIEKTIYVRRDKKNKSYYAEGINNKNLDELIEFTIDNTNILEKYNNQEIFLNAVKSLMQQKLNDNFDESAFNNFIGNKLTLEKIKELRKIVQQHSDDEIRFNSNVELHKDSGTDQNDFKAQEKLDNRQLEQDNFREQEEELDNRQLDNNDVRAEKYYEDEQSEKNRYDSIPKSNGHNIDEPFNF